MSGFAILLNAILGTPAATAAGFLQPSGWNAGVPLAAVDDVNPDPHIVEINLEAREAPVEIGHGQSVRAWTYNGSVPGPLIRARVGSRLVVHFTNKLEVNTTIHWHGVRVPNEMDGVPEHSQPAVAAGATFTYDFVLRDPGLFWYHPHVMSAAEVGFGLYGALLVDEPDDAVGVPDELVLVLSDIALVDGKIEPANSGGDLAAVFGREGTHVLVNGRTDARLVARDGAPQRWRLVNAAKSRYFLLDLDGMPFTIIGGDGGLQEYARREDALALTPGERLDVVVTPTRSAERPTLTLRSGLINRGFGSVEFRRVEELMNVEFADMPAYTGTVPAPPFRPIVPLAIAGATRIQIDLTLSSADGRSQYGINGDAFGKEHMLQARVGETQVWTVTNRTNWSHPFHLHGFFFQLLDKDDQPVRPFAWKDTVDVAFGETIHLAVLFDGRPGMWMYHCHILDHADLGMMGMLELLPASSSP